MHYALHLVTSYKIDHVYWLIIRHLNKIVKSAYDWDIKYASGITQWSVFQLELQAIASGRCVETPDHTMPDKLAVPFTLVHLSSTYLLRSAAGYGQTPAGVTG